MPQFPATDGVRLHYEERGQGPPIVFVHGWAMSGRFFHRQLEGLSQTHRCIALDLRGCGQSEARPGTHTVENFDRDLHALLVNLKLTEVTLVGWSLGGGVVMHYMDRMKGDHVRRVALIDFPPKYEEDPAVPEKVAQKLRTDRTRYMTSFFKRMFLKEPAPQDLAWMMTESEKCKTETAIEMYGQLGQGSSVGRRYDVPALLAFPRNGWFPKALPEWKEIFPRHVAPDFDESRHCPFLEQAAFFNAALAMPL